MTKRLPRVLLRLAPRVVPERDLDTWRPERGTSRPVGTITLPRFHGDDFAWAASPVGLLVNGRRPPHEDHRP